MCLHLYYEYRCLWHKPAVAHWRESLSPLDHTAPWVVSVYHKGAVASRLTTSRQGQRCDQNENESEKMHSPDQVGYAFATVVSPHRVQNRKRAFAVRLQPVCYIRLGKPVVAAFLYRVG